MIKLLKILGHTITISFEWVLLFIIFFSFAIHTSPVQTFITKKATNYLSSELKTEIKIDRVSIGFINKIILEGVLVKDLEKDTLAYISNLYVTLDQINSKGKIIINEVEIENSVFNLIQRKNGGDFNYEFLEDYFSGDKSSAESKPIVLELKKLHLTNVDFKYDRKHKEYYDFGMDYDHLDITDIHLDMNKIMIEKGAITANIKRLSAKERCGFQLSKFVGKARVSEKGIEATNVFIKTPYSKIYAPKVGIIMNDYYDYLEFIDSASFDGKLAYSKVSMSDISYFAPELEGMDQIVYVSGTVKEKTKNLKISNFILKTGKHTNMRGSINLPDFRRLDQAFFNQTLNYAYISIADVKKIKLPKLAGTKFIELDETIERLGYFEATNARLNGFTSQFVIGAKTVKTALGKIEMNNGMLFTENKANNSYLFEKSEASEFDVNIQQLNLGKLINNSDLGIIDGTFFLSGQAYSFSDIRFTSIQGKINQLDYLGYNYKNITVEKASFFDNIFDAKINIDDENLTLAYDGIIDLNRIPTYKIEVDIDHSNLEKLHIGISQNASLHSNFKLNFSGNQLNNLAGTFELNDFIYSEGKHTIELPRANIDINRSKEVDFLSIQSKLADISIKGKVDFKTILNDLTNEASQLFPAILPPKIKKLKNKKQEKTKNQFNYKVNVKELNEFLVLFVPDLKVSKGTQISGYYDGVNQEGEMEMTSNLIKFKELRFININLNQAVKKESLAGKYKVYDFYLNDSIHVTNLVLDISGNNQSIASQLHWNPESDDESKIQWNTKVLGLNKFNITLLPSFFNLKQKKWNVTDESKIEINGIAIDVDNFLLERENQFLQVHGRISENSEDQLNFKMNDFKLDDFGSLFNLPVDIKGLVNGWGYISNPYTNLSYIGDANIENLFINNREIGNIFVQTQWEKASNSFALTGDLLFKATKTFNFKGNYYPEKEKDKMDFSLLFDNTDLLFVNAFMDPDLLTNIKGSLVGELKVTGTFEDPNLNGTVELINGNAKLAIMNTNYTLNGKIKCDNDGFYINNMPIRDEEGNTGAVVASLYHTKFADWNFDINFNLEDNANRNGFAPGYHQLLDQFLVMNTKYEENEVYYGKAYATGSVDVFGYTDNLEITVDLKSENGTKIKFPMYGTSSIDEEEIFIKFKPKQNDDDDDDDQHKIDFTGVELNLNLKITPEAEVKIILNEDTGDEIKANGSGDFTIKLDKFNDLSLDGTFTINEGYYDFVMRPINQRFDFEKGGTVAWNGNPYDAILDLACFHKVNASLQEISPNQNLGVSGSGKQEIKCVIELSESLLKPKIEFDIQANTNENGQTLLNRIKSPDLLNKQFFSLLLFKKFQRIDGHDAAQGTSAGSNAALDLVSSQLNSMLSQISDEYVLNIDLDKNNITGGNSMALGVTKGFYEDRLVLTGSLGVGANTTTTGEVSSNQSSLIGDVNLMYSLNKAGTFKVNIFNESNQNSVLQNKLGLFTQGAGLQYAEEFNNLHDFQLFQYFIDLFRKKEKKQLEIKRSKKHRPTPTENTQNIYFKKEEWNKFTLLKTEYLFTTI